MTQQDDIKSAMATMTTDMAAQTTVVAGMSVFVAGIVKQLTDMAGATKDDETAKGLMALAAQAESNTKSLSDAMATGLTGVTPVQAGTTEPTPAPVNPNPFTPTPDPVPAPVSDT